MQCGTICWVREAKRFSLSGQVRERDMGAGEGGESHGGVRQKAKAQFLFALMPIFIPSLLACYMRTCNDISRRCGGGLGGTLSWAYMITGRGGVGVEAGHKSATAPRYPTLPTPLAGSLTPALPGAPPLISEEICNQQSPHSAPHQHRSS